MAVHHASLIEWIDSIQDAPRIAIITADFNSEITHGLLEKTRDTILEHRPNAIVDEFHVPGALELTGLATMILEKEVYHCVILHGCILRGSTPHFDYVCDSVTSGFTTLSTSFQTPIIFWVLTVDTQEQALERVINSYGIYALNYIAQRMYAESITEQRDEEIREKAIAMLQSMDLSQGIEDE